MENNSEIDYEKFVIKNYEYWTLYLHMNQYPYLGRCYAWAKRSEADFVTDATAEEINELFQVVIPDWTECILKFYDLIGLTDFRPNISILGNEAPHLHAHLIPRFKNYINYNGIEFKDPNPTGNYSPYEKLILSEQFLLGVKNELLKLLKTS